MFKNYQFNQSLHYNSNDVEDYSITKTYTILTPKMFEDDKINCNCDNSCHLPCQNHNSLSPFNLEECVSPNRQVTRQLPEMLINVAQINDGCDKYGVLQTKRAASMAGLNEEGNIENEYVSDEMIDITGKILTQIACTNLSYSTYQPMGNIKLPYLETHVCPVCQSHIELVNLSQYFLKSGMSDLNDIAVLFFFFKFKRI
jgi:hypothetical protein